MISPAQVEPLEHSPPEELDEEGDEAFVSTAAAGAVVVGCTTGAGLETTTGATYTGVVLVVVGIGAADVVGAT